MKKVAFYTLGCKLNFSETSTISRAFEEKGFQKVAFHDHPDIFIINTCSVTDHADKKCKKIVKEALKISPHAFIGIIGCYAQLKPTEIATIPGVDAVLGASEKFNIIELIDEFEKKPKALVFNSPIENVVDYYCSYSASDRTRTFLKVQDGCDYSCSFCTIPLARGKSRSDSIKHIVQTAQDIGKTGVKEIVLTGVNIGDFGIQQGKRENRFLDLIQALDEVKSVERFRISSIEPNLLSDEIITWVSTSKKFVPHFHIPLQSGSNAILKQMKRRYLRELYADRVQHVKTIMPDCCIGVDVIVGFPGESNDHFLETYNFLHDLPISYLHVFTYSERPNTVADTLPNHVLPRLRHERSEMLHLLSDKKRHFFYQENLGKTKTVIFEEKEEGGYMVGFTENYIKVRMPYDPLWINDLKKIKLNNLSTNGTVDGLLAESPIPIKT